MKKKSIVLGIIIFLLLVFVPKSNATEWSTYGTFSLDRACNNLKLSGDIKVDKGCTLTINEGGKINLNGYNLYNYGVINCDEIDYSNGGKVYNYGKMNIDENSQFFDLSLSNLFVYNRTIGPAFNPIEHDYTVYIEESINSIYISATLNSSQGVGKLMINEEEAISKEYYLISLTDDTSKIEITINSDEENAISSLYTINITRKNEHIHLYTDEWVFDEEGHWHQCEAPECSDPKINYHTHYTEWEIVKMPTYYEDGLEQRKCTVCEQVLMSEVISKKELPEHFLVTIIDLADYSCEYNAVPTTNPVYTIPQDGYFVDSNTNKLSGEIKLTSNLTIYKLKEEIVLGDCQTKSYTIYSGTLKDVPRPLTLDDIIVEVFRKDVYSPGDCDQTYELRFPAFKLRVYMPTKDELYQFGLKPLLPGFAFADYVNWQSTYFSIIGDNVNGGSNEFECGYLYDTEMFFGYVIGEDLYENGEGTTAIFDFSSIIRMQITHLDFLRCCEILEDKEVEAFTVYGDFEEHLYETEWTIDKEATYEASGVRSHHCALCDEVTDVEEIPQLVFEIEKPESEKNYKELWISVSLIVVLLISVTGYIIIKKTKYKNE